MRRVLITAVCTGALIVSALVWLYACREPAQAWLARRMRPPDLFTVRAADGIRLATEVRFPDGRGPWPAILVRTPYDRRGVRSFTGQGYVTVVQNVRGTADSEGDFLLFGGPGGGEGEDGAATLRWILAQPWSNGEVATYGGSAMGITQNLLAARAPSGPACQHISAAPFDLYSHFFFPGGVLRSYQARRWIHDNGFPRENLAALRRHRHYDDFWRARDASVGVERMEIPAVHVAGWFDIFLQGTLDGFAARSERGAGAGNRQYLIIGPWGHGTRGRRRQGDLVFPANVSPPAIVDPVKWFDHCLGGAEWPWPAGALYYAMGPDGQEARGWNEWRASPTWPPESESLPLYPQGDRSLSPGRPVGQGDSLSYVHDPADPVPTVGGIVYGPRVGPRDQREAESRDDVLVFTSPPLRCSLEVTGRLWAELWVDSSCPGMDYAGKLTDVYPDGRSIWVADGITRVDRVRRDEGPSGPRAVRIDLWSSSRVFAAGHRIRFSVASSSHPKYEVNGGEAGGSGRPGGHVCRNRLFVEGARASSITLPVVLPGRTAAAGACNELQIFAPAGEGSRPSSEGGLNGPRRERP